MSTAEHDFRVGDRVVIAEQTYRAGQEATITKVGPVHVVAAAGAEMPPPLGAWVEFADGSQRDYTLDGIGHIRVAAEHVGQWARVLGQDARGEVRLSPAPPSVPFLVDARGRLWHLGNAVLVAPPAPAPAFPFVGARAQVTVAENAEGRPCEWLRAGDEVTLRSDLDAAFTASTDDGRHGVVAKRNLRPVSVSPGPDQDESPIVAEIHAAVREQNPDPFTTVTMPNPLRGARQAAPGPDQPTEHEDWRVCRGRYHYGVATAKAHVGCTFQSYPVTPGPEIWRIHLHRPDVVLAEDTEEIRHVGTFARPEDAARAVLDHQYLPGLCDTVTVLTEERDALVINLREARAEVKRLRAADTGISSDDYRRGWEAGSRDAARAELDAATTDGLGLPQVEVQRDDRGFWGALLDGSEYDAIGPTSDLDRLRRQAATSLALLRARLADEAPTDDKETDR